MRWRGSITVALVAMSVAAMQFTGCSERQEPVEVDTVEDLVEKPVPPEPPSEDQARQIVAKVTRVKADDVTIVDQAAAGDIVTIEATIPAHEKMRPHHAAAPDTGGGAETEQRIEWVRVRWNMAVDRPRDIIWPERLQFAREQPITADEVLEVARALKDEWFPKVPPEMVLQEPRELNRPAWAVTWRGNTEDGVLTGDQVVVQVSGVTGLPIAYSQRVAVRRPSRDEIKVTRTEAINAALDALAEVRAGDGELEAPHLAGQLVLSAAQHPEGGPAWLLSGTVDGDVVTFTVDAMSGELLAAAGDFEFEEDTVARDRPLDAEGLDGFGGQPAPEGDE